MTKGLLPSIAFVLCLIFAVVCVSVMDFSYGSLAGFAAWAWAVVFLEGVPA